MIATQSVLHLNPKTDHPYEFIENQPLNYRSNQPLNAGTARGQKLTGSPVVARDLINAGANFIDAPAVFGGDQLLTSRTPNDLPQFMAGILELLSSKS